MKARSNGPCLYNGKNVMITGVTGFVGKVFLEKYYDHSLVLSKYMCLFV